MISPELSSVTTISSCSSIMEDECEKSEVSNFQDIIVQEILTQAKFTIYLAFSPSQSSYFAMKVYPYIDGQINPYFINEIRFAYLQHTNILSPSYYELERVTSCDDETQKVSFILTPLAPYGDFFELLINQKIEFDDVLLRTYFHQLITGLEFLHSRGVYHLDIKLENLLLGEDFNLKIMDFDLAHTKNEIIREKGTKDYRSPEVLIGNCRDPAAADVYSSGIVLFVLKSKGVMPHSEDQFVKGQTLFQILEEDPKKFWKMHCRVQGKTLDYWDNDFKDLFISMVNPNPEERATIQQIKASKWYNGPTYQYEEVCCLMQNCLYSNV